MSSKADRLDEFNFGPVKVLHEVTVLFQTWWPNGKPTSSDRDDSEVDLFGPGSGGEDGGSGSPIAGGPLQQVDDDGDWEDVDASQGSDGPLAAEGGACLDLGGDHLAGGGVSGSALAVFSRELAGIKAFMLDYISAYCTKITGEAGKATVVTYSRTWHTGRSDVENDEGLRKDLSHNYTRKTFNDFQETWCDCRSLQLDLARGRSKSGNSKYTEKAFDPIKTWLLSPDSSSMRKFVFNPAVDGHTDGNFNLFQGLLFPLTNAMQNTITQDDLELAIQPGLLHIHNILANGNREVGEYILDWMAHVYQKPWKKTEVALILVGPQGCGKGWLGALLRRILGELYCEFSTGTGILAEKFQKSKAKTNLLSFIDEALFHDNHMDRFKTKITENTTLINEKNLPPIEMGNYSNLLCCTNHRVPFTSGIEVEDRRTFATRTSDAIQGGRRHPQHVRYFVELWGSSCPEKWAVYLARRDITNFKPAQYPDTPLLLELKMFRMLRQQTSGGTVPHHMLWVYNELRKRPHIPSVLVAGVDRRDASVGINATATSFSFFRTRALERTVREVQGSMKAFQLESRGSVTIGQPKSWSDELVKVLGLKKRRPRVRTGSRDGAGRGGRGGGTGSSQQVTSYMFPTLQAARGKFEKWVAEHLNIRQNDAHDKRILRSMMCWPQDERPRPEPDREPAPDSNTQLAQLQRQIQELRLRNNSLELQLVQLRSQKSQLQLQAQPNQISASPIAPAGGMGMSSGPGMISQSTPPSSSESAVSEFAESTPLQSLHPGAQGSSTRDRRDARPGDRDCSTSPAKSPAKKPKGTGSIRCSLFAAGSADPQHKRTVAELEVTNVGQHQGDAQGLAPLTQSDSLDHHGQSDSDGLGTPTPTLPRSSEVPLALVRRQQSPQGDAHDIVRYDGQSDDEIISLGDPEVTSDFSLSLDLSDSDSVAVEVPPSLPSRAHVHVQRPTRPHIKTLLQCNF